MELPDDVSHGKWIACVYRKSLLSTRPVFSDVTERYLPRGGSLGHVCSHFSGGSPGELL